MGPLDNKKSNPTEMRLKESAPGVEQRATRVCMIETGNDRCQGLIRVLPCICQ
jgi:hypothetical protein